MNNKKYELVVSYNINCNGYIFTLDYGTYDNSTCNVLEDGSVLIDLGVNDQKTKTERMSDLENDVLVPMFGVSLSVGINKVEGAFKKAENFISNYDIFVKKEDYSSKKEDNNYVFNSFYDENLKTITFYIKSKLFDDEIGIIVYPDGSFNPVISVKHINLSEQAKKERLEALKTFIYNLLKIKINFGKADANGSLRIPELYNKAKEYSLKNSGVQFTDDADDIYVYEEGDLEDIKLNGIHKF